MIDELFLYIGNHSTPNMFEITTLIQEILWSGAELLIVFSCLKIANAVRVRNGKPPIVLRFIIFWCVLIANPILLITVPGVSHDKLMLLNFSIMIYTAIAERNELIKARNEIMKR